MPLIHTDFLIIGSGIAGLFSALKLQKLGKVTIVTKTEKYETNTSYAQGGIASVFSIQDNLENHYNDTLKAGAGLCNPEAVQVLVSEGPRLVQKLFELGVPFNLDKNGNFSLSREGGHSKNRIVHVADQTGKEIQNILLQTIKERNIEILEYYSLIDLITPHHLNKSYKKKVCYGAYILNNKSNETLTFIAKKTILATGGSGQVYLHTTNPKIATGDGIACAYRAGTYITNMEFYQFHPTFFHSETGFNFLISETVRGEGATLETKAGFRFMKNYHKMMELAPRDIVARAIDAEMKKKGQNFVYLNLTHLSKETINFKFPFIKKQCEKANINIFNDRIPVVPAAHYMCGGVDCNLYGETNIENLFTVGEVSHTGIHGANRLASNSLLECIVFSERIYQLLKNKKLEYPKEIKDIPQWKKENRNFNQEGGLISNHIKEIQTIMSHYVGIVRSNFRLERAEKRINLIFQEVLDFYHKTIMTPELLELRNLIYTSSLIIRSAKQRKESRGLHYNIDYKEIREISRKDTVLQSSEYL